MRERKRELYVEGGGDRNPGLASECRKAFSKLFEKAGVSRRPRVIACGGRQSAYNQFCLAHAEDRADTCLLVDAEDVVPSVPPFDPWAQVEARPGDRWQRPRGATDEQLQLMAVCMETWLLADCNALKAVLGPKLDESKLPPVDSGLETVAKDRIYDALDKATKPTPSGAYRKGAHLFKVLACVSPSKLRILLWAKRFLDAMGAE